MRHGFCQKLLHQSVSFIKQTNLNLLFFKRSVNQAFMFHFSVLLFFHSPPLFFNLFQASLINQTRRIVFEAIFSSLITDKRGCWVFSSNFFNTKRESACYVLCSFDKYLIFFYLGLQIKLPENYFFSYPKSMIIVVLVIFLQSILMENLLPNQSGVKITRFNYYRPKWFGGFFGFPHKHNTPGNCVYDKEAMAKVISPENLNQILQPLYLITPVLAYHLSVSIFLSLSVLLTVMQQGFNFLIEYAFLDISDSGAPFLKTLGVVWYCIWVIGFFTIIPLYYVSIHNIEHYFKESSDKIFEEFRVRVKITKDPPSKFLLIQGFKKIDSLEIISTA